MRSFENPRTPLGISQNLPLSSRRDPEVILACAWRRQASRWIILESPRPGVLLDHSGGTGGAAAVRPSLRTAPAPPPPPPTSFLLPRFHLFLDTGVSMCNSCRLSHFSVLNVPCLMYQQDISCLCPYLSLSILPR
ncbi:hypothetical protein R5R35_012535 [Gryllus longicercus]|uniref:Uncharacterized protein n=1 Tax=Gryllus longicercus TaxID=2509291 RepID=A0AAN9Z2V9_9ORTH